MREEIQAECGVLSSRYLRRAIILVLVIVRVSRDVALLQWDIDNTAAVARSTVAVRYTHCCSGI